MPKFCRINFGRLWRKYRYCIRDSEPLARDSSCLHGAPHFSKMLFSVLKFLKVIFPFILHPLILRKSMCYGSRRGPLPNNTSFHLIAKLRKVIIILGGPTGRSPGSPTGQSAPGKAYSLHLLRQQKQDFGMNKTFGFPNNLESWTF